MSSDWNGGTQEPAEPRGLGAGIIVAAWLLILALLATYFGGFLDQLNWDHCAATSVSGSPSGKTVSPGRTMVN